MRNLNRRQLQRLIKLEIKQLMDEDALFRDYDVPGDDDNYEDYSLKTMNTDCGCGTCPVCNDKEYEDHDRHHKSYMAKPQLRKIAKYASKLFDMVEEGEQLEDWQESKIAQMAQMIGDVYHSIEYDEEYDEEHSAHDDDMILLANMYGMY